MKCTSTETLDGRPVFYSNKTLQNFPLHFHRPRTTVPVSTVPPSPLLAESQQTNRRLKPPARLDDFYAGFRVTKS